MIKLVATDVDGTLVPEGSFDLNQEYFDVINKLKDSNIKFAVASGRQYDALKRLFKPVADRVYFITDNGGFLRTPKGDCLHKYAMDKELVKSLVIDAQKILDVQIMLCAKDCAYFESEDSFLYKWMRDDYRYNVKACNLTKVKDDIVKVSIYHPEDAEKVCNEWFCDKWKDKTLIASAGLYWVDCIDSNNNKGEALKVLMSELNLNKDEVMCFGDNINDLGMLNAVEHSYAVGSAREEVRIAAKNVCDTMESNGVLKVLKTLV